MSKDRARLCLKSGSDALELVSQLRNMEDAFYIESCSGSRRINAKSLLGVLYTMLDFMDGMYLVNDTHAGCFPPSLGCFLTA